jgi:hypothetical protein
VRDDGASTVRGVGIHRVLAAWLIVFWLTFLDSLNGALFLTLVLKDEKVEPEPFQCTALQPAKNELPN